MKVKIFNLKEEEDSLLEEKINNLLFQENVVSIEVVTIGNLLIIFYERFVPKC